MQGRLTKITSPFESNSYACCFHIMFFAGKNQLMTNIITGFLVMKMLLKLTDDQCITGFSRYNFFLLKIIN
jgi:hypothetical protein